MSIVDSGSFSCRFLCNLHREKSAKKRLTKFKTRSILYKCFLTAPSGHFLNESKNGGDNHVQKIEPY